MHKPLSGSILKVIEAAAVLFNLLFTFLYIQESRWCFFFGILGPILLGYTLFRARLYAEIFLQLVYVVLAVFGWLSISTEWDRAEIGAGLHGAYITGGLVLTMVSGYFLRKKTDAKLPYIDSWTTIFSILATFLMMIPVHEAWLYFICINIVSLFIYIHRKLYFGAFMFLIYLLMSLDSYFYLGIFS